MHRPLDEPLALTQATFDALEAFLSEPKFVAADLYWEPRKEVREVAEYLLNDFIVRVMRGMQDNPTKGRFLAELAPTLQAFSDMDSDEQDRLMGYIGRLLDMLGIDGTDGMVGAWRYGDFDAANDP